ncbi:DUF2786 domain-containing protein [Citrobacter sp. RHBSTW-00678]|uniref:DUF2786 domain-containing protein n=1 Tax=Citrobacter sp. RHBSTW-00678 TaxID=2742661 RepID=UPI0015EA9403|nr:DUF2786 domain-containing protein [Citrobacter sp. RHBSTW-00678]QLV87814.1 DUF2786 domain-containing protein [Citrobacter sp. RHBSTW-00678]
MKSSDNKERYLQKIKKLLNLARRSTNANEAASAMNKALDLMRVHGVSETDVDLLAINEAGSKTAPSDAEKSPKYMHFLAHVVQEAFGVECYISWDYDAWPAKRSAVFYGPNERPQIAAYAFDVLSRQMMKARREFISGLRKGIKTATKTARGDVFCEGWVNGVFQVIQKFAVPEAEKCLIECFHRKLTVEKGLTSAAGRESGKVRGGGDTARMAGFRAGKNASINHGVDGATVARIGNTTGDNK